MLKQAASLFKDARERESFVRALCEGGAREQAIIVLIDRPEFGAFPKLQPLAWQPPWIVRLAESFRPARHTLHDRGAYYCLDFSSVFAASVMLAIETPPRRVLDLCASPGGKAIFAWRAFDPEVLMCNESVRKRTGSLIANLERCGVERSQVWSADSSVWVQKGKEAFDLVLVDAPCSGQSLLAKGNDAHGCFSPTMIDMCVGRQRRIVGNAYHCLRPGGYLLYMTCTYAIKENEKLVGWLLKEYPDLEAVEAPFLSEHASRFADFPCYRMFPHQGLGAGAFSCLVRKRGEPPAHWPPLEALPASWRFGDFRPPSPIREASDRSRRTSARR
jgi:16S rRNA C967 or C1407 C5-methylase (RsmB/RsmF family)